MLNQIVVVGRLQEIKKEEKGANVILAVPRSFKNADGEYETDHIPVRLWGSVADNTAEWCNKGDLVGIKGRMQETEGKIELIGERVTFLSSKKQEEMAKGDE